MFGAFSFGQGYFGQGPLTVPDVVVVVGPIDVIHVVSTAPEVDTVAVAPALSGVSARRAGVTGSRGRTGAATVTARTPSVRNVESS